MKDINEELLLAKPGVTVITPAPMPTPKADEVLIRVEYVGICGSDVHSFQHGPFIPPKDPAQKIGLGHEYAGVVVGLGSAVTHFHKGDRVCVEPGVPCGVCEYCRSGRYNICPHVDFLATQPNYRGALARYICHKESFTYLLPDHITMLEGALVEPAAVGFHAATLAGVRPSSRVAILGAGCIGLMTLQACRVLGASHILMGDLMANRRETAMALGCEQAVNTAEVDFAAYARQYFRDEGPDVVFETAGSAITTEMAVASVVRGGRVMVVGTVADPVPIRFLSINREVSIQTVFRYANCYRPTIDAIASGQLDVASMVTSEYVFEDSQRAFEESVSRKREIVKAVIHIDHEGGEHDAC